MKHSLLPAALLTTLAVSGCGGEEPPRETIPTVTGYDLAAAECLLAEAGFRWRYGSGKHRRQSSEPCEGRYPVDDLVCTQRPAGGARVLPDSVVVLQTWSNAQATGGEERCIKARTAHHDARIPVLDLAFTYFRTAKIRRGRTACRLMTRQEQRRVGGGEDRRCAAVLNARLGPRLIKGRETVGVVLDLNRSAGTARASVLPMSIRGTPPVIRLRRSEGAWRIFDSGL